MYYILYNPLSANGGGVSRAQALIQELKDVASELKDIREVGDYAEFMSKLCEEDSLVIAGGDGTLNKFINYTYGMTYPKNLFYYATGSGNDFLKDVADGENKLVPLGEYIKDLPVVTVKGKTYRFINGIGYGIDGYCCEVGDAQKKVSDKPVNYTSIAIKGLLFHYKPTNATVTVDGVTESFTKVWLAPTMNGRYYGGGMNITPDQDRLNANRSVSLAVFHGSSKLKTLIVFPSIFKGKHIKHDKIFKIMTGHEVKVTFDRPVALQIDGETILDVSEYTVSSACKATAEKENQTANA